ncbi:LysR family transcriptional regulator [Chengkuizengella axinellae]|uniref:LysR family transcriptional regulator n=1 Tax=Chengkuizengella axinellae TaxID=3064388 RepID=A0ABT9J4A6_9BACL|nr:LysR family transcriptional regulator [Chengkuizengella sp. 2205SS18-9]MDP5276287.1 LysR family transcriptional regulator [Chengkuizengella sp. 2205SS18-9]
MDTDYYRTFIEVVKWKNYTKAAESLGYAQSSVTTQIKKIEAAYGVRIFERMGRAMQLTQSGEHLYKYALKMISLEDEAMERLISKTELNGSLTIGTVESYATFELVKYFQQFNKKHPQIKLQIESNICSEMYLKVIDGTYDIALVMDQTLEHDELNKVIIRKEEMVLVGCANHQLSKRKRVTVKDLKGEKIIYTEKGCSYRMMLEQALKREGVCCNSSLEFNGIEIIKRCVDSGLGVALLPKITVEQELKEGTLSLLPLDEASIEVYVQLVVHKKKWMSPALKEFIQLLNPQYFDELRQEDNKSKIS